MFQESKQTNGLEVDAVFSCDENSQAWPVCTTAINQDETDIFNLNQQEKKESLPTIQGHSFYKCPHCSKSFQSKTNLLKHCNVHIKPFKCRFCEESYSRRDYLKRHEYNEHREQAEETEDIPLFPGQKQILLLQCNFCPKVFRAKSLLDIHERKHTGIKPFHCENCPASFTTVWNLKTHQKKHVETSNFVCKTCGKTLSTKVALNDHMTVHTGERPHKCEKCGSSFKRTTNIWRHKRRCKGYDVKTSISDTTGLLDVSVVDSDIFDVNDDTVNNFKVIVNDQRLTK